MPKSLQHFDIRVPFCVFKEEPQRDDGHIRRQDEVLAADVHGDVELITPEEVYAGTFNLTCYFRLNECDTGVKLMGINVLSEPEFAFEREPHGESDGLSIYREHEVVMRVKLLNAITDYLIGKKRVGRDIRLLFPILGIADDE